MHEPLTDAYNIAADAARMAQQAMNKQAGIGLQAQAAGYYGDRLDELIEKYASYETAKEAEWLLGAPVKNFVQSAPDNTLRKNAEFQSRAGLRPRIIRKPAGACCEWCSAMAGVYDYPDKVPRDVYRRHANCNCVVEYDPGAGKRVQNVWSKRWTRAEESGKIEKRKEIGADAETFLNDLADHPAKLGTYTPETLKRALEEKGCNVKPLSGGNLKNRLFEDGGGYKTNFHDGGLLMYHPEERSHHEGEYYKISTGKRGLHRYDRAGNEIRNKRGNEPTG